MGFSVEAINKQSHATLNYNTSPSGFIDKKANWRWLQVQTEKWALTVIASLPQNNQQYIFLSSFWFYLHFNCNNWKCLLICVFFKHFLKQFLTRFQISKLPNCSVQQVQGSAVCWIISEILVAKLKINTKCILYFTPSRPAFWWRCKHFYITTNINRISTNINILYF